MKRTVAIIGLILLGLIVIFTILRAPGLQPADPRTVHLAITGAPGQLYSGTYVADGVTNQVSHLAPGSRISFLARDVTYEFKRQEGEEAFRVELSIDDLRRLSTPSGNYEGIRGNWRYTRTSERYSAETF